ncbi:MAG: glycosyltransferase family 2 protein [Chloroflexota bacterium]
MNNKVSTRLSIITVSWNVSQLLRDCLASVEAVRGGLDLEMVVVDSASSDDTPDMVEREFPWVNLIRCTENVGFPKGNNIGIEASTGDYVILLNPDTVVLDDALSQLCDYMDAHQDVGVVGPKLLNPDGSIQSSRRRFPTFLTGLFESTWLQNAAPKQVLAHYFALDLPDDETAVVDWVMGAALLTRRSIIERVGGLDEDYFMYSEELDWCRRIKAAGWEVIYYPSAQIVHHLGKSSEQAVTHRHINFNKAKLRYFRKYHGPMVAFALRAFLLLTYLQQLLLELLKGIIGHKRPLRWQRAKSYWQVVRSGLRPAGY